jgi:DNA-binding TFAR19-related protein (PDSD5 family)
MQEEVENRTVALAVSTTRMTGRVLKAALIKLLAEMKKSQDSPPQIPMASRP